MADAERLPNAASIACLHGAPNRRQANAMVVCHAPDAAFSDPGFPPLDRWRVRPAGRAGDPGGRQ